jgi:hypothetical protein
MEKPAQREQLEEQARNIKELGFALGKGKSYNNESNYIALV